MKVVNSKTNMKFIFTVHPNAFRAYPSELIDLFSKEISEIIRHKNWDNAKIINF